MILTVQILYSQNNWLSSIEDDVPLSTLSIPGTHNSATGNKLNGLLSVGVTQHLNIEEQWEIGVRAFDFRPDIKNKKINIYHGVLKARISFIEAIETILGKLDASPREFAIVLLRQERFGDDSCKRELWGSAIGQYIESLGSRATLFRPGITVGEMRGKILFLSRSIYAGCKKGACIKGWNHSERGTNSAAIVSCNDGKEVQLLLQDFYSTLTPEKQSQKLSVIKSHIESKSIYKQLWSINYLSGYSSTFWGIDGIPTAKGYLRNAAYIHKNVLEYIKGRESKNGIGIVMMDFVGCESIGKFEILSCSLLQAIIDCNNIYVVAE